MSLLQAVQSNLNCGPKLAPVGQWDGANASRVGSSIPCLNEEMNELEALQKALMNPTLYLNGRV